MKKINWRKLGFEFVSIFIAVVLAFALTNWNENRKDKNTAKNILTEILNGLEKDVEDININKYGHKVGIRACEYWRQVINNEEFNQDSVYNQYFRLTRDFFSAQNISGYETLKSKGLELIKNDSLRFNIISLYEYNYRSLKVLEETYYEAQFQANYFSNINDIMAPYFIFDEKGTMVKIRTPIQMEASQKNILLSYLWKIQVNRNFILSYYDEVEKKINELKAQIDRELD